MNNRQSIIYVMRHIDIGGYIDIPYKKVGITGAGNATLTSRLQQISNTKSPIKAQCVAAWEHDNAQEIENALHSLLEDSRIEGEWFIDKDDSLVDRMQPIMNLLGATELHVEESEDSYTKNVIRKENENKNKLHQTFIGEISNLLNNPLRTSVRKSGPTLYSEEKQLTYYIGYRKSGNHNLSIGRSKDVYDDLKEYLESQGYDCEKSSKEHARIMGISAEVIAEIINTIEEGFENKKYS